MDDPAFPYPPGHVNPYPHQLFFHDIPDEASTPSGGDPPSGGPPSPKPFAPPKPKPAAPPPPKPAAMPKPFQPPPSSIPKYNGSSAPIGSTINWGSGGGSSFLNPHFHQLSPDMQTDIMAATHASVNQEDAIQAHSLSMHMNQIENQRRRGRQALQAQADSEIHIEYMVPMPPRPKPKALAIQNPHPQDVHMEPVHPQFQRIGPPPIHQSTQRGQTYDFLDTFKPKQLDPATISIPDHPDDDLHPTHQTKPKRAAASSAAAASSSSSSSAAAAPPAKAGAKAAKPEHTAIGTPPKPSAKMSLYVLNSELKSAYQLGLITDPEDKKEYEEILATRDFRSGGNYRNNTDEFTKNIMIRIYRGIYSKIKDR
jgi:hypothetical protein